MPCYAALHLFVCHQVSFSRLSTPSAIMPNTAASEHMTLLVQLALTVWQVLVDVLVNSLQVK
jgi:hypothetical protein